MYSVYASVAGNTICIHDDEVADSRVKLIDPTLELEKNTAGTFTFKLAPNNQGYKEYTFTTTVIDHITPTGQVITRSEDTTIDMVSRMQSTIKIYRDGTEIWEGRVLSENRDWYNLREITCEGELAYFNDACQTLRRYSDMTVSEFFGEVLKVYNAKVEAAKRFVKGAVTIADAAQDIGWRDTKYENTMSTINQLLSDYGGILRIRKVNGERVIDWLKDYPNVSTQVINFGKNLLDFRCTWDMSSLCTVLLPTGKVLEDAGQDAIGDVLVPLNDGGAPTTGQLLELDENNKVLVKAVPELQGYKTAVYSVTSTLDNPSSVYLSSRLHGGFVSLVAMGGEGGGGDQLAYMTSTQESGAEFKDYIDYKVTLPGGTKSVIVCSFGDDIPLALKKCIPAKHTIYSGETLSPYAGDPTSAQLLYLDESNIVQLKSVPETPAYKTAIYDVESTAEDLTKVYITCRLNDGYVAWVAKSGTGGLGSQLLYQTATQESGASFKDFFNYEVTLPAGTHSIIVCSYGDGIPLEVKKNVKSEVDESDAPLGKYLTIEDCADDQGWHTKGSPYVAHPDLVKKYGWIEKQLNFENIEDKDSLYSTSKNYLKEGMFDEMEIELSAIDMHVLGVDAQAINLLDQVQVVSEPHDLNKLFPVNKLSIPLNDPTGQKFTLGSTQSNSLTNVNNEFNEDVIKKITVTSSETLNNAKKDAASLIGMATNGFITFINDEDGNPKELVISNTKDPTMCTNCWIWNVNGLGHADHYPLVPGDEVNVAMTMDGSIVADRITTGVLASILIRGCRAVFGGMDGEDGTVLIKSGDPGSATGSYCVDMHHGGLHFGNLTAISDPHSSTHGSYTVEDFAKIQSDKVYQMSGGTTTNGLVIDSKVCALDINELWVSTKSSFDGGGTDAVSGSDAGPFWLLSDNNGAPGDTYVGPFFIRHGIVIGDYRNQGTTSS